MRFKVQLEYDGRPFAGWQVQSGDPTKVTVQSTIETALESVIQSKVRITGAGRTDTGVHASLQVMHFDSDTSIPLDGLQNALNFYLPGSIRIRGIWIVDDGFHARFRAIRREYQMLLSDTKVLPPFWHGRVTHIKRRIDEQHLNHAIHTILGPHNFQPFAIKEPPERRVHRYLSLTRAERFGDLVKVTLAADGFLRRQVRMTIGAALMLERQKKDPDQLIVWLNNAEAWPRPVSIPGDGLYLTDIDYPPPYHQKVTRQFPILLP